MKLQSTEILINYSKNTHTTASCSEKEKVKRKGATLA